MATVWKKRGLALALSVCAHALALAILLYGIPLERGLDRSTLATVELFNQPGAISHAKTHLRKKRQVPDEQSPVLPMAEPAVSSGGDSSAPAAIGPSQPAPASAVSAGAAPGPSSAAMEATYISELRQALAARRQYPVLAKSRRQSGRVEIGFTIEKSGAIKAIEVLRPSPFELLNTAAAETVRQLGSFRPVPDEISAGDWHVVVPIDFVLSN